MGNRKSTGNTPRTNSSRKGHGVVRLYGIIYHRAIFFRADGCFRSCYRYVTGQRYASLLHNHVIPAMQQRGCVNQIIFMQDGAPPHIANSVKQHFRHARITSCHFRTTWLPRSTDLNLREFWLWSYLKDVVFSTLIADLAELKACTGQHIHNNVTLDTLQSVVEHAVSPFQLLAENGGRHTEYVLHQFC